MQHIVPVQSEFFPPGNADHTVRGLANQFATGIHRNELWVVLGIGKRGVCVIAFCDDYDLAIGVQRMYDLNIDVDMLCLDYLGDVNVYISADEIAAIFSKREL